VEQAGKPVVCENKTGKMPVPQRQITNFDA
jgi:hypothetical protein